MKVSVAELEKAKEKRLNKYSKIRKSKRSLGISISMGAKIQRQQMVSEAGSKDVMAGSKRGSAELLKEEKISAGLSKEKGRDGLMEEQIGAGWKDGSQKTKIERTNEVICVPGTISRRPRGTAKGGGRGLALVIQRNSRAVAQLDEILPNATYTAERLCGISTNNFIVKHSALPDFAEGSRLQLGQATVTQAGRRGIVAAASRPRLKQGNRTEPKVTPAHGTNVVDESEPASGFQSLLRNASLSRISFHRRLMTREVRRCAARLTALHRPARRRKRRASSSSSSAVNGRWYSSWGRWWRHRSRHCLEERPGMWSATRRQWQPPCSSARRASVASSSGVHAVEGLMRRTRLTDGGDCLMTSTLLTLAAAGGEDVATEAISISIALAVGGNQQQLNAERTAALHSNRRPGRRFI
ncbi:hypothetical protein PR202_ga13501 [Eleusine coracana subsp. coracana]|uniref:Uncharacterized protein n=1 Tax=Eleusine coracana subsp. coracana TaxID=191504 RepID=A0AAV5CEW8_ELECO|nr:hypothetical protein PR202_ga13501 [Eleusine coracana subsp. coracana]